MIDPIVTTGDVYLDQALAPLQPFLDRDDVSDIHVNAPGEVWIETLQGGTRRHMLPELSTILLDRLVALVAAATAQGISREHPLLSATLANGARLQAIIPPATRHNIAVSIRKHRAVNLRLSDYTQSAAFDTLSSGGDKRRAVAAELAALNEQGDQAAMLALAVKSRCNILVSGGTSTGKTTFLNALLAEIDAGERLILIEDTPELNVVQPNHVGLIAARSVLGESDVTVDDLVSASLRMRPDRIILGELRGPEAFSFLRAINTGHPGSMTTVHADSPVRAIEQITLLVLQAGTTLSRSDIAHYVGSTIDLYVQLSRIGGRRCVSAIMLRDQMLAATRQAETSKD